MERIIRLKAAIVSLVLVLTLVFGAGCLEPGIGTSPTASPSVTGTPASTPTQTPVQPGWTPPVGQGSSPSLPDMVAVVAKVRPSVVAIDVQATSVDIFNQPFTQQGAGSGWIIDPNGLIVTNNHVVEGATDIKITLGDGRTFPAVKVSTDSLTDLAVVKIDATGLPAAKVGDSSKMQVGMLVAAIGNSLGRGISMTGGWVSRLGVSISTQSQTLYDLIETDAAINPGNSGGPLVNTAGEVIGITSAKLSDISVEGVGYAIAINTAMPIIQDLITKGYAVRPYFGINVQTVTPAIAQRFSLAVEKGALITRVVAGSPAANGGLKESDVIVALGTKEITGADELVQAIRATQIGQPVKVTYWRGNNKEETNVTPGESPRQ